MPKPVPNRAECVSPAVSSSSFFSCLFSVLVPGPIEMDDMGLNVVVVL